MGMQVRNAAPAHLGLVFLVGESSQGLTVLGSPAWSSLSLNKEESDCHFCPTCFHFAELSQCKRFQRLVLPAKKRQNHEDIRVNDQFRKTQRGEGGRPQ